MTYDNLEHSNAQGAKALAWTKAATATLDQHFHFHSDLEVAREYLQNALDECNAYFAAIEVPA